MHNINLFVIQVCALFDHSLLNLPIVFLKFLNTQKVPNHPTYIFATKRKQLTFQLTAFFIYPFIQPFHCKKQLDSHIRGHQGHSLYPDDRLTMHGTFKFEVMCPIHRYHQAAVFAVTKWYFLTHIIYNVNT